jgi:hypothetical protein
MSIIAMLFSVLAMVATLWATIGSIPGFVFLILFFTTKDKTKKAQYWKWSKIGLGGIAALVGVMILYFLLSVVGAVFGFSINPYMHS